jgi:hypothetical protein
MQIYLDGKLVYQGAGSTVDSFLNFGSGTHSVVVKAWDRGGASYMAPALYVTGSGAGVFLQSPAANATVNGSVVVQATAVSSRTITAMQIYDNGNLVNQTSGAGLNTTLPVGAGSHHLVVKAWDTAGTQFMSPVVVNSGSSTPPPQPPAGDNGGSSQVSVPANALPFKDIDQMGGWQWCGACSGIGGQGPEVPFSLTQNIQSPSLDGRSAIFWLGGTTPWSSALWWKQLGAQDGTTHFVYDLQFFIQNPAASQALEFDVNQSVNNLKYIFGTECDVADGHHWRVWDTLSARWMATGASCELKANAWNHLTWEFERVGGQTHFVAVTLNGYRQVIDKYYSAKQWSGRELNVAFQMDGNYRQDDYSVWVDKVALYAW